MFTESEALIKIEQTICTVTLDVDFSKVFIGKFFDYLNRGVIEKFSSRSAKAFIRGMRFSTEIFYEIKNPDLASYNIPLYPTHLTIEPRIDTPLKEKRFYTASPTDSDTHIKLLEEFENLFKDESRKA
jgi:hypothetical protein